MDLPGLLLVRIRSSIVHPEASNQNKERGTYAIFAIGFPHTKCGCMVLLWSSTKRLQYCYSERVGIRIWNSSDFAVRHVQEEDYP
nr:hypothetical protein Iba_chr13cCG10500 [Ipomoea batatas]GME11869.1 hypothetical protein Iba_scaffold12803CG0020 [Ipomoea batatas]